MEARILKAVILAAAIGSLGASYRTTNFIIDAPTDDIAQQIGRAAERYRKELAVEWLGREMPAWNHPCPITAQVADHLGAGGATSFMFDHGEVFGWKMSIQGSLVRILDSVLPHEVTHTIFATHFRQPLPRWADEGSCTTVEHYSERAKQQTMLIEFLHTGRGIPFSRMFAMKNYPQDVMPLYSQGYSVARFLIAQGGKQKFLTYLADGLKDENWTRATATHYRYTNLGVLQNEWLNWVRKGSPALDSKDGAPAVTGDIANNSRRQRPQPNLIYHDEPGDDAQNALASFDRPRAKQPSAYLEPRRGSDRSSRTAGSNQGWKARSKSSKSEASREPARELSRDDGLADDHVNPEPVEHQVIRPQPVQKSRQVILEWSRPQANSDLTSRRSIYAQSFDN